MDLFSNLALGFSVAISPMALLICLLGVSLGMVVGVLPGLGAITAIAMLLPVTYYLEPTHALIMLAGIYYGAAFGGSTASILLNLPGTPSSAITALDGYPLGQKGKAGVALLVAAMSSFFGGTVGVLLLATVAPALVKVALSFSSAEYFSVMLLGLIAAVTLAEGSPIKGLIAVAIGLLFGLVGADPQTGSVRYGFGIPQMFDGFSLVAVVMGLFGVAEVMANVGNDSGHRATHRISFREMLPSRAELRQTIKPILRGSAVGSAVGILPGTGVVVASFMAYALEKKISKTPERFGQGAIEGISAPEAANNACTQTTFIPTLAIGIPGDAVTAIMLSALILHGITPGPTVIASQPDMFWGLVVSFWIGNLILVIMNIPLVGIWVKLLSIPYRLMYPSIILFICIGVYSVNNSVFDIFVALGFGLLGLFMRMIGLSTAPLLLGFVLGPMMESHFRRALTLARGDLGVFFDRPVSAVFLLLCALFVVSWIISARRTKRKKANAG
ncbi:tripartite tricarboxylate transporter permease [Tropicimonas isoalkanivorans]|uniref:TctA family transporter n=1 Tax=Tropicimonas isoalkanivorans TaxID=441112 RepID=A0A1I1MNR1_9RHOB|nr:tripartite tricarboxylate transporter permease [Tropicimonas isoalkanivorans]SFC87114.1 TctA family transporter [Tropicimonas isoalkanivorans]